MVFKKNFVGVGKFLLVPKTACGLNDILFLLMKHAKKLHSQYYVLAKT
jgi:hypothetical protein